MSSEFELMEFIMNSIEIWLDVAAVFLCVVRMVIKI